MLKWLPRVALSLMLALAPLSPLLAAASYSAIGGNATLAVTGSSSSTILPGDPGEFPAVQIINDGANEAFVAIGGSSVTASTSTAPNANNLPLPAGGWLVVYADTTHNYVAGIGSGSTTLRILQWNGLPSVGVLTAAAGGGGGGGSVTQGTTPWVDNITQWASGVLAAMANYGTAPSGLVPGVNAFVTNAPAVTLNASSAIAGKFGIDQTTPGTTNLVALAANQSTNEAQINGVTPLMNNGVSGTGSQRVNIASDNTAFAVNSQPTPVTSGGLTTFFLQPTASDNHANIKNGAGQVYRIKVTNNSATLNYLRLYNAATGFNGCNSATNLIDQWAIPASTSGAGFVENIDMGLAFSTGISICVTSGYATTDTTNATASAMSVGVGYK